MAVGKNLSGIWRGYYSQHGHQRPITAEIKQAGDQLEGWMSDEVTEFEASVSEMAMEEGLPPGADEQIVEQVRTLCPWATADPVRAEIEVPAESRLEGEVEGDAVRFLKTYQGSYFAGYRVGDVRVGITGEDQEVHYRGVVSPDGSQIEGQWQLPGLAPQGIGRTEGGFLLRRVAERVQDN